MLRGDSRAPLLPKSHSEINGRDHSWALFALKRTRRAGTSLGNVNDKYQYERDIIISLRTRQPLGLNVLIRGQHDW